MTDEDAITERAIGRAMEQAKHRPNSKWVLAGAIVAVVLAGACIYSLILGLTNKASQTASQRCTTLLANNQAAQAAATQHARDALVTAAHAQAAAELARANDVAAIANTSDPVAQAAALADFQAQSEALSLAWQDYADSSVASGQVRDQTPTDFRC